MLESWNFGNLISVHNFNDGFDFIFDNSSSIFCLLNKCCERGRGGGILVSALAYLSEDLSLNPAGY